MTLKAGDKAPDFTAKDQDSNDVKLSSLKGKKVVLYFYPRDMTEGCTFEACSLRDNYKFLQKAGYEVLGVSTDDETSHRKFIEKENLPFTLLADPDKKIHSLYGTWIEKSMYGRKYMGTARVTFLIDEKGTIEEIIEKVDTRNHANQILKKEIVKSPAKKTVAKKQAVKTVAKRTLLKPAKKGKK
jgi:thioredoxin-dependent peroxiredoxin